MTTKKPGERTEMVFVTALAFVGVLQVAYLGLKKIVKTVIR